MEEKIKYWLELSDYDLDTAQAMLRSKRYLYVGFMCHQVIEKIFKAYYVKLKSSNAPFTHSLSFLAKKGGFSHALTEEQTNFIDQIEPLNIETRYPAHQKTLLKRLTKSKCEELLKTTENLQKWTKMQL